MDRLDKIAKQEARWQFSQQAGLFDRVFARPIFGLIWWWWLFVTFLLSIILTTPAHQPFRRSFYVAAFLVAAISALIAVSISSEEKRGRWLAKQNPIATPVVVGFLLRVIPWVCAVVIVWSFIAR